MMDELESWVATECQGTSARRVERVQSLWSGYGEIVRVALDDGRTVVVKDVRPPDASAHPRGWGGRRSHERKLRSYRVEARFYAELACDERCRVPRCHAQRMDETGATLLLEDLDAAGYAGRGDGPGRVVGGLTWLAHFHARFLGHETEGLWAEGTYWHLATRPDELEAMAPGPLRDAAAALDAELAAATHRTLVHGDAKLANFCFAQGEGRESRVAAVDFQYVGGGCGMRDVAYFLGSALGDGELERRAEGLLDGYFGTLRGALQERSIDPAPVEREWRALYPIAWADFERFLAGWAPGHAKRTGYSRRLTDEALARL